MILWHLLSTMRIWRQLLPQACTQGPSLDTSWPPRWVLPVFPNTHEIQNGSVTP